MDDQPFTTVEKDEFCDIVLYLKLNANIPSADTIDALWNLFKIISSYLLLCF